MNGTLLNTQQVLLLNAEDMALSNVAAPATNQRYRKPTLSLQYRKLGRLEDDHVRVRIKYAGICGTDIHLIEANPATGYVLTSAPAMIPEQGRVIGHEAVGQVIEAGRGVAHVSTGDHIAIASVLHCMYCQACRQGLFNQCLNAKLLGMELDGLFGDVVDIPASLAHDVSSEVDCDDDLRAFACLEPAGTSLLACETCEIRAGDNVVVFGGGPIGILSAIISKRVMGASKVTLIEPLPFRREFARQWCDAVFDVEEFFSSDLGRIDAVIEASGQLSNVTRVFRYINFNGRVVMLARSGSPLLLDSIDHMITQAITISACRGHLGGYLSRVVSLYKAGTLPLLEIVTGQVDSLEGLGTALANPALIAEQHCKLLVKF